MSPEKSREILNLLMSIFSNEWIEAFEILCGIGVQERSTVGTVEEQVALLDEDMKGLDGKPMDDSFVIDTLKDAREFFKVYWGIFKLGCAERRLFLTKDEVIKIFEEAICCREAWFEIVDNDVDFFLFQKMARHDREEAEINQAKNDRAQVKVMKLERLQAVRRAIERNLLGSKYAIHVDRLKVTLDRELDRVIQEMEGEGVWASPKEMSEMLLEIFPHIPKRLHHLLNKYVSRLQAIKDNPTPKLKATIYGSEQKPKICITKVVIDHRSGTLNVGEISLTFDAKGIVGVLTALQESDDISLEEFAAEVNNLLEKIMVYCQENKIPGFLILVGKLHKAYGKRWEAQTETKSPDDLKIGLIYTSLGMYHFKLAEDHIDPEKSPKKEFE